MRRHLFELRLAVALAPFVAISPASAQLDPSVTPPVSSTAEIPAAASKMMSVTVKGKRINYRVTAEEMPVRDSAGTLIATLYSTSYVVPGQPAASRPVIFLFNGGPGSASVGVHPGIGPRRFIPAPPELGGDTIGITTENTNTALDAADLVFYDPVGTGYSRRITEAGSRFWGVVNDARATSDFITWWLRKYNRTASPVIIGGESYGGTRMVLAAKFLEAASPKVANLRGLLMISPSTSSAPGTPQDRLQSAINLLPSLAAVAAFHKKGAYSNLPTEEVAARAVRFAENDYRDALVNWDSLSAEAKDKAAEQTARFVGLAKADLLARGLRVSTQEFRRRLLASTDEQLGTDDGRNKGLNALVNKLPSPYNEPGSTRFRLTYNWPAAWERYFQTEIGYKPKGPYYNFANVRPWNRDTPSNLQGTARMLNELVADNPGFQILLTVGYFDLTIPYRSPVKALQDTGLPPEVLQIEVYRTGHVVHTDLDEAPRTSEDIRQLARRVLENSRQR